jgi:galactose mutarotase-like enzyme
MITLENEWLSVDIHPKGAELQRLYRKDLGLNYLWKGDPTFWGKHSPLLFPIVGELKDNTYYYQGKDYHLPRHGFARDREFEFATHNSQEALFTLQDDPTTLEIYPFPFLLEVHYSLKGSSLEVAYVVHNPAETALYFCIGGHPAFAVPLIEGQPYDTYQLTFSEEETAGRYELEGGLLQTIPSPFLNHQRILGLTTTLFAEDALVFKGLRSHQVTLGSPGTTHGLHFHVQGWPYLGIWAAPNAPFVCIEPWQGHADDVNTDQELIHKEGIIKLEAGDRWEKSWKVDLF